VAASAVLNAALGRLNSVGDLAQSHFHFAERSVGFVDGAVGSGNERRLTLRFTGGAAGMARRTGAGGAK
jgi:hypothetical protein